MEESHVWHEIRSVVSVTFVEAFLSIVLLVVLSFNMTFAVFNREGVVDQSVDRARSSLQLESQYGKTFAYINESPQVGNLVIFSLWATLGLIVCNIIFFLRSSEKSIADLWRLYWGNGPDSYQLLEQRAVRLAVRTFGLIGLIAVVVISVKYLLPLITVAMDITLLYRLKDYIFSVISVWLVLSVVGHISVVMLRFLLLRRRLIFNRPSYIDEIEDPSA